MLTYDMNGRGQTPLYEYLYRHVKADILSGTLAAGERLPSRRTLAEHLRVSVVTVESAYRQLEAEGYVYTSPRRGVFVSRDAHMFRIPPGGTEKDAMQTETAGISPSAIAGSTPSAIAGSNPSVTAGSSPFIWKLDLGSSQTSPARFPAATWARLTRQVLSEAPDALFAAAPHQGIPELRHAIAEHLRRFKGMSVSPEQIIAGAGAEYLYILLAQLFSPQAVFALEDPGYPKIRMVYRKAGAQCRPVPLDAQGLDIHALSASGAGIAHLSPAHHFPTGTVMPAGRRHALLRWAVRTNGYLIEDDYDSELRFTGRPIPPLQSIDRAGRVIYMNTFSQTISPAMRMGYLVLPPALLEKYRAELGFYACTVPALEQQVLARFLSRGHYEQHLSRMRKEYRTLRTAVLEAFRHSRFSGRVRISEQDAGLHFLCRVQTSCEDHVLRERARVMGVRLRFLSEYAATDHPSYAHTLVISYAGLSIERIPEAVSLLERVFDACP